MNLQLNTLIEWQAEEGDSRIDRVLAIDQASADVVTIDVKDKKAFPVYRKYEELETAIVAGRAQIVLKAEYNAFSLPENEIPTAYSKRRDKAWKLIQPLIKLQSNLLFNRHERGRLIAQLAKKESRRKFLIYQLLRQYWQRGATKNALLPAWHRCGQTKERQEHGVKLGRPSNGGRNVTADDKAIFRNGIKKFVLSGKTGNLRDAWQLIKETYYAVGTKTLEDGTESPLIAPADTLPHFEQFEYFYRKHRNLEKEIAGREGQNEYDRNHRPVLEDTTRMAFGPGSVYQIDATVGDIYLVNYLDRKLLIGRPVIYIVIDVFSRLIVGLAVTLEGPSWEGARLALENAFLNKVALCKQYGINITEADWPVEGKCERLLGDNGEIKGYNANSLVSLGMGVANAAAYRPDWKAIVERSFRTLNDTFIHWSPGAVRPRRDKRGKDYRLEAVLDLNQFRQLMIECVLFHNNARRLKKYRKDEFMIPRNVEPVPIKLWRYGIRHYSGLRKEDPEAIRLNLLPSETASVTPEGIYFRGLHYTCDKAVREQWFVRLKGKKRIRRAITFEPHLVDEIYLRPKPGKNLETCYLTNADKRFSGRDWYEVQEHFALERQANNESETDQQQAHADFHAKKNHIINTGIELTAEALENDNRSKSARTKGIKANRKALRDHERKERVQPSGKESGSGKPAPVIPIKPLDRPPVSSGYIPPAEPYDELREARERALKDGK